MSDLRIQLKHDLFTGVKKGWHAFIWICQIVIPISLVVTLLQWTGWLNRLDFVMHPLMNALNLPPEAALPIITGMLINIYAGIAALSVIPFNAEQMTLIAIFNLIAHSLIMEAIVQHKSGLNAAKATIIRIAAAIVTVFIVSQFFSNTIQSVVSPITETARIPIVETLISWGIDTAYLLLKILGIIIVIMVLQEALKSLGWLDRITRFFGKLMRLIGLTRQTTMSWLTAIIFGLLYGGGVIIEEARKGKLTQNELENLHIFIGINHSMIEDPLLFAVLGLNLLWLWIPRFIMAIIAVQAYRLVKIIRTGFTH
jgi:hypothetical protein